ncbi:MAG: hypothetical protein IJ083_15800 [Clostridia bacterium]|nr:hypothetical protein [Clostridia bacterium]
MPDDAGKRMISRARRGVQKKAATKILSAKRERLQDLSGSVDFSVVYNGKIGLKNEEVTGRMKGDAQKRADWIHDRTENGTHRKEIRHAEDTEARPGGKPVYPL